ncbi:MAG: YdeI/OmpD-associated family protein [Candidatus Acidiferrales bacterium]
MATIYKIWLMRHVDVPVEIGRALERESGKKKHIPVVAIVNGKSARVTLVPAGGGRYRLHLNTALRKAARADAGDLVSVELRIDRGSRSLPVPPDLSAGLKRHPKAWRAFQYLAPGHRRHFIQWFDSAKSGAARERRLERAVDALLERALLRSPAHPAKRKSR